MQIKNTIKSMSYKICSIILAIFLVGCALMQPTGESLHKMNWQDRKKELNSIKNWRITGSISITHDNKTDIGAFFWQKRQGDYIVELSGPMSLGKIQIIGDNQKVVLYKSAHEKFSATTPEELLFKQFGWKLPVSNLIYWVKGMPAPGPIQSLHWDDYGHLSWLKQQGWEINYSIFKSFVGVDLPTHIYLWKDKLRVKIVVKQVGFG